MASNVFSIIDVILDLPAYVFFDSNLNDTLQKMFDLKLKKITVIDKNTNIRAMVGVKSLFKFVKNKDDRKKLSEMRISDILDEESSSIVAYPHSNVHDVLSIMQAMKLSYLPVAMNPWEKRLIGFVDRADVERLAEAADSGAKYIAEA